MKLKSDAKLSEFIQAARVCQGEVYFKTEEGDILNLKSQLSQYLFLAALAAEKSTLPPAGEIVCDLEADYQTLAAFLNA